MSDGNKFAIWAGRADMGDSSLPWRYRAADVSIWLIVTVRRSAIRLLYLGIIWARRPGRSTDRPAAAFRTYLLPRPGMIADDLVYLRGVHEEIWSKLPDSVRAQPHEVLQWMLDRGAEATLRAYGGEARSAWPRPGTRHGDDPLDQRPRERCASAGT